MLIATISEYYQYFYAFLKLTDHKNQKTNCFSCVSHCNWELKQKAQSRDFPAPSLLILFIDFPLPLSLHFQFLHTALIRGWEIMHIKVAHTNMGYLNVYGLA